MTATDAAKGTLGGLRRSATPSRKIPEFASKSHVTHSRVHSRVPPYSHAARTMFASKNQRAAASGILENAIS
jgi:hypothetical protein